MAVLEGIVVGGGVDIGQTLLLLWGPRAERDTLNGGPSAPPTPFVHVVFLLTHPNNHQLP